MGLGGVEGPPKKKLKQAQLNFCVSTEKASNKRKLSDPSDGLAPKLLRTDPGTPKTPVSSKVFNKENVVVVSNIDKSKDDIQKNTEQKIDVVVLLDDDLKDDKPGCNDNEAVEETPTEEKVMNIEDADVSQKYKSRNEGDLQKSGTDPTQTKPAKDEIEALSTIKDGERALVDMTKAEDYSSTENETDEPKNDEIAMNEVDSTTGNPGDSENVKTQADAKLDQSVDSELGVNTSAILSSEDEQMSSPTVKITPTRNIIATPKSATKKAERERQREERLRLKKEKEEQKQKEKEEKEKKKQEELRLKEEEKKRKEEERKRKDEEKKRKEEERKKREEAKEEERRKKEEEKRKKEEIKEEDRRKKEEARLAEERKENLAKAAFTKFFITEKSKPSLPKKEEQEVQTEKTERPKFMPFPVKSDMRLAVQVRHTLTEEEKNILSEALASSSPVGDTYLQELKKGKKPKTSPATWPLSNEQHDVIIVESVDDEIADIKEEAKAKSRGLRAKLLLFHENRRPPYWGTWQKCSKAINPRRPFGQDKILDYEVDSDSEWEDEEEGEDIEKEDGDSEKEEADDENVGENGYMLDNTFVPHGYLSDEEADEVEEDESVENQKLKLTVLKREFDQELKSKTQRLQPRLLGCVKIANTTLEASKSIYELLMKLRCKWDNEEPIDVTSPAVVECNPSPIVSNTKFPSSMVEQLAKLIHGNRSSMKALITEFMSSCDKDTQLSAVSKRAVFLKVKEIAAKTYSTRSGRLVWTVNPDLCAEFGLQPIVDPQKIVPVVSPVVDPPKPKDSPLANFLKKSTPQGPKKRIATTLIPRDTPSGTPSSRQHGPVHIDTPRPKFTPQGSILASQSVKPIRRVATTLLSSVAGPVKNKTFNVSEIDKPGQIPIFNPPNPVSTAIDLTDSSDGITPLPDECDQVPPVLAACNLSKSPVRSTSPSDPPVSSCDSSAQSAVPSGSENLNVPAMDALNTVTARSNPPIVSPADKTSITFEPTPMETDTPTVNSESPDSAAQSDGTPTTELANAASTDKESSPMETDDLPEPHIDIKKTISIDDKPSTVFNDSIPPIITDDKPPTVSSDSVPPTNTDDKPPTVSSDSISPTNTDDKPTIIVSSDSVPPTNTDDKPSTASSDSISLTNTDDKPSTASCDSIPPTITDDKPPTASSVAKPPTVSSDTKPQAVSNDGKPPTVSSAASEARKSVPSTPTPIRKRVPLVTLSKSVPKTKNGQSPGQNVSISDMFCRKLPKKDIPSKPVSSEPSAAVDLSTD